MIERPRFEVETVSHNLKRLRLENHYSVKDVQDYLGVTNKAVYKFENGRSCPSIDNLLALMKLYKADVDDILEERAQ